MDGEEQEEEEDSEEEDSEDEEREEGQEGEGEVVTMPCVRICAGACSFCFIPTLPLGSNLRVLTLLFLLLLLEALLECLRGAAKVIFSVDTPSPFSSSIPTGERASVGGGMRSERGGTEQGNGRESNKRRRRRRTETGRKRWSRGRSGTSDSQQRRRLIRRGDPIPSMQLRYTTIGYYEVYEK